MPQPRLQFWYEFASTYSYLSASRISSLAANLGVEIDWRPFLLGPIFNAQGWNTSPFNIYPAKGRYMMRDIERLAGERDLVFRMPTVFPAKSLLAARVAVVGQETDWCAPFTEAVFEAQFANAQDISERNTIRAILQPVLLASEDGDDADNVLAEAGSDAVKSKLREQTETAESLSIFGAPSFVTPDGELFWGDDRLEQALHWAQNTA